MQLDRIDSNPAQPPSSTTGSAMPTCACSRRSGHGRYVTFQLAEVAVPRELFRKILSLIDGSMIYGEDPLRRRPGKSTAM